MEALRRLAKNAIKLDINKIIREILRDKKVQQQIISLNIFSQLHDQGIDSRGVSLGEYSDFTKTVKESRGQLSDHITLQDTGEFYESFFIDIFTDFFEIKANPIKEGRKSITNLFVEWGKDIVGLTIESLQIVGQIFLPLIQNLTLKALLK